MSAKNLKDIIDINFLQSIQDTFSDATGMASICVDLEGPVTTPSNFTEFCIDLTRSTKEGLRRCNECDLKGGREASGTGRPSVYYCHAGLMDFGAPIIVDGEQVGSILGGQVLTAPPDEAKFRRIADEIGVNPDRYINALRKVKIMPEKQIRQAAMLMYQVIQEVIKEHVRYNNLRESYDLISSDINGINTSIREFSEKSESLGDDQAKLLKQLKALSEVLESINSVVSSISKIAQKTQMISINASIEAARSGLEGRSFSVIAQEIRMLATETNKMVIRIKEYTREISETINTTLEFGNQNADLMNAQAESIADIFPRLNSIIKNMAALHTI